MDDIPGIVECHRAAYPEYPENAYYTERFYDMQFAAFPEGQFLVEADGLVVGYATSLIVQLEDDAHWYTYEEITGGGTFSTHDPSGDTLYGADIGVRTDWRRRGVSMLLYERRINLLKRYNLRRMIAYGRIPGYTDYAGKDDGRGIRAEDCGRRNDRPLAVRTSPRRLCCTPSTPGFSVG